MLPERIGRYEILRVLGKGAMGVVYLARDPQIERELALKTIRFDHAEGSFNPEEAKARFLKEAKISGRLQHPHIVTIFDVGEDGVSPIPTRSRCTTESGSSRRSPRRSGTPTNGAFSTGTSSRRTSS